MIRQTWYAPAFSSLLADRRNGLIVFWGGGLHLGLNLLGLEGWVCPIRAATGIPCPGCGLTTSAVQFLQGNFVESLRTHAFVPVFFLAFGLMVPAIILPKAARQHLVSFIHRLEVQYGVTAWVLVALVVYWGIRLIGLVSFPKTF